MCGRSQTAVTFDLTDPMQLHVEATGVAHRLPVHAAPPQGGGAGAAVGAAQSGPAGGGVLQTDWTNEKSAGD